MLGMENAILKVVERWREHGGWLVSFYSSRHCGIGIAKIERSGYEFVFLFGCSHLCDYYQK